MEKEIHYIGCSGYYYSTWKNAFYPPGTPARKWLQHYSSVYNTVELNGTFYRLPSLKSLEKYYQETPPGFRFSVKVSRYITHILGLKNAKQQITDFIALIEEGLREKINHFLFQLPATFTYSPENLDLITSEVPHRAACAVEFRHISWWNREVESAFRHSGLTFCNTDYPGLQPPFELTSDHFYLRLHGVPQLFKSAYTDTELQSFVERMPKGADKYSVYFNNTWFDAAYKNACMLMGIF